MPLCTARRWDLRDRRGVVQTSETGVAGYAGGKDYARGTNFTCMATSGDGYVAVGAKDGKIRLYSSKTLTQVRGWGVLLGFWREGGGASEVGPAWVHARREREVGDDSMQQLPSHFKATGQPGQAVTGPVHPVPKPNSRTWKLPP